MRKAATALLAGVLFAVGLAISGMARPAKVIAFLDVTGNWDPSLALVMGGGMAVFFVAVLIARRRGVLAPAEGPQRIDGRLVGGAALFGIGWGISGYCPGPALVSAATGALPAVLFVGAMIAGMLLRDQVARPVPAAQAIAPGALPSCQD